MTHGRGAHRALICDFGGVLAIQRSPAAPWPAPDDLTLLERLVPNEPMLAFVDRLRSEGMKVGVLTNNAHNLAPGWDRAVFDLHRHCDSIVDAAVTGVRKPARSAFQAILRALGDSLRMEECVLVDDISEHCDVASELGMTSVHFRTTDQAIRDLSRLLGAPAR